MGQGDIGIGGATLAAEAAALDLSDEYRAMIYPVLVGGGVPFFPQDERRVDLELVETRTFSSRVALPPPPRGALAGSGRVVGCVDRWKCVLDSLETAVQGSCTSQR